MIKRMWIVKRRLMRFHVGIRNLEKRLDSIYVIFCQRTCHYFVYIMIFCVRLSLSGELVNLGKKVSRKLDVQAVSLVPCRLGTKCRTGGCENFASNQEGRCEVGDKESVVVEKIGVIKKKPNTVGNRKDAPKGCQELIKSQT